MIDVTDPDNLLTLRARRWHVVYVPQFEYANVPPRERGAGVWFVTAFDDRADAELWVWGRPQHEIRENPDWAG